MGRNCFAFGTGLVLFLAAVLPAQAPPLVDLALRNPASTLFDAMGSRFVRSILREPCVQRALQGDGAESRDLVQFTTGLLFVLRDTMPTAVRVQVPASAGPAWIALSSLDSIERILATLRKRDEVPAAAITRLQQDFVVLLERLGGLQLCARLEFRRESSAEDSWDQLFTALQDDLLPDLEDIVRLDELDDGFDLDVDLGRLLGLDDPGHLSDVGVLADRDERILAGIERAAGSLRFALSLRREGAVLDVSLHRVDADVPPPLAPAVLEDSELFSLAWSLDTLLAPMRTAIDQVTSSLTADELDGFDTEESALFERLAAVAAIESLPHQGSLQVRVVDTSLRFHFGGELAAPTPTRIDAAPALCVPGSAAVATYRADLDLPGCVLRWLGEQRGLLTWYRESFAPEVAADPDPAAKPGVPGELAAITRGLERRLSDARGSFAPGCALVISDAGRLAVMRESHPTVEGPIPALALVGRVRDRDRGLSAARIVLTMCARALGGDESDVQVGGVDLVGSPPCLRIARARLGTLFGDGARWQGDLCLHAFALGDDILVLSTSERLSRELIEARASAMPSRFATRAAGDGVRWNLESCGRDLAELATWSCRFADLWITGRATASPTPLGRIADCLHSLGRLVGPIRFQSRVVGTHWSGTGAIHFGVPTPSLAEALAEVRAANGSSWPEGRVLVATGSKGRFEGRVNPFRFVFAEDCRFDTRVSGPAGIASAFDGRESTLWNPFAHAGIDDAWNGAFQLMWAATISGAWAEPEVPFARELIHADEDLFQFELADGERRRVMRVDFDRVRGVVTRLMPSAHRATRSDLDPVTRFEDQRLVDGRMLPHRIVAAVDGESDPLEYPVESWEFVDAARETFRVDGLETPAWSFVALERDTLPLTVQRGRSEFRVFAEVVVDGDRRALVEVSFHDCSSSLRKSLLDELGAPAVGDDAAASRIIRSLQVGPLRVERPVVGKNGELGQVLDRTVDGYLGLGMLEAAVVEIDLVHDRMRFLSRDGDLAIEANRWRRLQVGVKTLAFEIRLSSGFSDYALLNGRASFAGLSAYGLDRLPLAAARSVQRFHALTGLELGGQVFERTRVIEPGERDRFTSDLRRFGWFPLGAFDGKVLVVDVGRRRYAVR